MVMEVSSTYIRNFSAALASRDRHHHVGRLCATARITTPEFRLQPPLTTSTTSTTTTGTELPAPPAPPEQRFHVRDAPVPLTRSAIFRARITRLPSLPGATFEAVLNDSATRVLQSPQIRAVNNVKAISRSEPSTDGERQLPARRGRRGREPAGEHAVHISGCGRQHGDYAQLSRKRRGFAAPGSGRFPGASFQNLGGIQEPEIGQNKLTADIRLREGEVNLIGGIIQQTDSKARRAFPVWDRFRCWDVCSAAKTSEKDRTELVVAIIPHVVRGVDITDSNLRGSMPATPRRSKFPTRRSRSRP